jgi:hypothetical protein
MEERIVMTDGQSAGVQFAQTDERESCNNVSGL